MMIMMMVRARTVIGRWTRSVRVWRARMVVRGEKQLPVGECLLYQIPFVAKLWPRGVPLYVGSVLLALCQTGPCSRVLDPASQRTKACSSYDCSSFVASTTERSVGSLRTQRKFDKSMHMIAAIMLQRRGGEIAADLLLTVPALGGLRQGLLATGTAVRLAVPSMYGILICASRGGLFGSQTGTLALALRHALSHIRVNGVPVSPET
jgi:hypothetical protein